MSFHQYFMWVGFFGVFLPIIKSPQGVKLILVRNYSLELGDIREDFQSYVQITTEMKFLLYLLLDMGSTSLSGSSSMMFCPNRYQPLRHRTANNQILQFPGEGRKVILEYLLNIRTCENCYTIPISFLLAIFYF